MPRYWTGALPAADFAHVPWGEDGPNREGRILRFRQLAVRDRARQVLVEAKLVPAKSFLPLREELARLRDEEITLFG